MRIIASKKMMVVSVVLFLLSIGGVSAQLSITDIQISPDIIWIHNGLRDITISAGCVFNGSDVTSSAGEFKAVLYKPSKAQLATYNLPVTARPSLPETGTYRVDMICRYTHNGTPYEARETVTDAFKVHKLELEIVDDESQIDAYLGDTLTLKVRFKLDGVLVAPYPDTFRVYLRGGDDWEPMDQISNPVLVDNYQEISINIPLYDDEITTGQHDLKIKAEYSADSSLSSITEPKNKLIWINEPLKAFIKDNKVVCSAGILCEKNLTVDMIFHAGSIEDFGLENVEAVIIDENAHGERITVEDIRCRDETETCSVSINLPCYLSPGSYELFLTFGYPDVDDDRYNTQDSIPVDVVLTLSGTIKDAARNIISTVITTENVETGKTRSTTTNKEGVYNLDLLPGIYNIAFKFAGGTITKIYNVSVSDFDLIAIPGNMIRYDQNHLNSGEPGGVKRIKIIVIEFALPSTNAWVYVPYDSTRVMGDEKDIRVYKCENWNFMKSACTGEWEIIESEVHNIRDSVEFNTDSSAAFLVGENKRLSFSVIDLENDDVDMGDPVVIEGKILDDDAKPVDKATILLSFPGFNISRKTVTSERGMFTAKINAPHATGTLTLFIQASKGIFNPINTTKMVHVSRRRSLGLVGIPDIVDIELDKTTQINFTLINSGQTNFTEPIYIHVNGMPSEWYELSPAKINTLAEGEQKFIGLKIRITPEICGGKCKTYTLVNIEAKSKDYSKALSFSLKLVSLPKDENQTGKEEQEESKETPDGGGFVIPSDLDLSGLVISMPSLGDPYLSLTLIVILLVLVVHKKKTEGGGGRKSLGGRSHKNKLRAGVVSSLSKIRDQI